MTAYSTKITFGEMRDSGVRDVLIYCRGHRCSRHIEISADGWTDDGKAVGHRAGLRLHQVRPAWRRGAAEVSARRGSGRASKRKRPAYRPGGSEVKFGNCNAVIQPFGKSTVCSLLNIRQIDPQLELHSSTPRTIFARNVRGRTDKTRFRDLVFSTTAGTAAPLRNGPDHCCFPLQGRGRSFRQPPLVERVAMAIYRRLRNTHWLRPAT